MPTPNDESQQTLGKLHALVAVVFMELREHSRRADLHLRIFDVVKTGSEPDFGVGDAEKVRGFELLEGVLALFLCDLLEGGVHLRFLEAIGCAVFFLLAAGFLHEPRRTPDF